jgi:uncharacterized repeat protein (TIGR01451 family)
MATIIAKDTISWQYSQLSFDSTPFTGKIKYNVDAGLTVGDTVCFVLESTTRALDLSVVNYSQKYCMEVSGPYDPNDIAITPSGLCVDKFVSKDSILEYFVRFQNTGNYHAVNISVIDTLSANLDVNSIRLLHSSHHCYVELLDSNVVQFSFDNIYLQDSVSDEPNSHGNFSFSISPKKNVSEGVKVENRVDIYFDFNPAIQTNSVGITLVDIVPDCINSTSFLAESNFSIYPNPSSGIVQFPLIADRVHVFSIIGEIVFEGTNTSVANLSHLRSGSYVIRVFHDNVHYTQRVIIIH